MASSTSYLQGAHHNRFENLTITHVAGNAGRTAMEYLEEHITIGAIHNSDERCDAPTCFPETRVAVQEDILSWITQGDQDDQPMKMLWLSGPAGSGKTAIAGSVAEACQARGILAGSFFFSSFSQSPQRSSKRSLVATLAYQLFKHETLEAAAPHVSKAIQRDPAIFKMKLKDQLEALILNPLRQLRCQFPQADLPKVFIIDGVDEVKVEDSGGTGRKLTLRRRDEDDHLEIISSLFHASKDPAFPFHIIVISRPERVFTEFFAPRARPERRIKQFFLDKKYAPDSDIRLYLTSKFAEIRRRYNLSPSWPDQDIVEDLVRTASGQFIYAATVIRFVLDGTKPPPAQLQCLLETQTQACDGGPFDSLDALYTHILLSSPSPRLAARWILSLNSLSPCPAWASRLLIETEGGEGEHVLRPLASLISIPTSSEDRRLPYRVYHKSLIDFLRDDRRCPASVRACEGDDNNPEQFLAKSWVALLKSKAPRIGIAPSEQEDLIKILAQTSNAESVSKACSNEVASLGEEDLLACDIYWWMSEALKQLFITPDALSPTVGGVRSLRSNAWWAFKYIHEKCPPSPSQCRESCKKWRDDIKKACADHGWKVPSKDLEVLRDLSQTDSSYSAQECIALDWRCRNGFTPRNSKYYF